MTGDRSTQTLPSTIPTSTRATGRRISIPLWERTFAVVGLFLCLDAGIRTVRLLSGSLGPIEPLDVNQIGNYVEGSGLTQGFLFAVYLVSIVLLLFRPVAPLRLARKTHLLWLLLGLAAVSILWSGAPTISFRRIVALLGSAVFGLYLATRYPRVALLRVLLGVSVVATVLSVAVCVALPAYGIDETGAWQGVFDHKNHLGQFMALAAAAWLLHAVRFRQHRPLALGLTAVSGLLVFLSRSATAVVILATLLAVLLLVWLWRLASPVTIPIVALIFPAGIYLAVQLASDPGGLLGLLGKNATLTGRTQLWDLVWQAIGVQPWFGYGYGGFWLGLDGPSAPVWLATGWNPPTAHNGFLDLLLDLGAIGLVVFALAFLANLRRAVALLRHERSLDAVFPLVFLAFLVVSNLTESYLVTYNTLAWVLFAAFTIQLRIEGFAQGRIRARAATNRRRVDWYPDNRGLHTSRRPEQYKQSGYAIATITEAPERAIAESVRGRRPGAEVVRRPPRQRVGIATHSAVIVHGNKGEGGAMRTGIRDRLAPLRDYYRHIDRRLIIAIPSIVFVLVGSLYALLLGNRLPFPDEQEYYAIASNLVHHRLYSIDGIHPTAFRTPGYPWLLAAGLLLHFPIVLLRMMNFIALGASAYLLSKVVQRAGFPLAACIAPYLLLCYPVLFYTAGTLYPQTIGMTLLLLCLSLVLRDPSSLRTIVYAGLAFGVLILFIPSFLLKLPLLVAFVLLVRTQRREAAVLLFTLATLCVVGLCTVNNYANMKTFIPLSTNTGVNFLIGNSEYTTANGGPNTDISRYEAMAQGMDEVQQDAFYRAQAFTWIRDHKVRAVTLYLEKTLDYFNYRNDLLTASEGSGGKDLLMLVTYGPLLLLAVGRVAMQRWVPLTRFEIACLCLYIANAFTDAIVFSRIRYRLPFDVFVICLAATAIEVAYHRAQAHDI